MDHLRRCVSLALVVMVLAHVPAVAAAAPHAAGAPGLPPSTAPCSVAALRRTASAALVDRGRTAPAAGDVTAAAADDDIPGVPIETASELPWPVILESLDATNDSRDVYALTAYPGDQISFYAAPETSTLTVAVSLYDAAATSTAGPAVLWRGAAEAGDPAWLCYTVPAGAPSTSYYVVAEAMAGSGAVECQWGVTSRSDGNVPGVTLPPSGFTDTVVADGDADDVFAVHLGAGETLEATVTVTGDALDLYLFGPGQDDVTDASAEAVASDGTDTTLALSYTAPPESSGVYFMNVHAGPYDPTWGGEYSVVWSVTGANVPGRPLPASGSALDLAAGHTVFHVDLRAGERFTFRATDPGGALSLALLSRDAVDVSGPRAANQVVTSGGKTLAYTVPPGKAGRYYIDVAAATPAASTVTWSRATGVARLAGRDRYQTAVRVSERDFADGADTVVIASGAGFADALSAAGLAGAYDAPVLLVPKTVLPAEVRAEIVRLRATRCLVVGGPAVVDGSVLAAIDAIPGMQMPKRIWGQDRYATSALVADAVFTKDGIIDFPTVTYADESLALAAIARGDAYPDALALAPIAWAAKMPVLLTHPDYLPVPIDDRLPGGAAPLLIQYVVFAGGPKAISGAVYTYVDAILPGNTCQRIAGNDRYETAKKIADWSAGSPWLSYEAVGVATGVNFPDALGGGAGIAKGGGVLLMTEPRRLTPITGTQLAAKRAVTHEVQVFGGTAAVTDPALAQIRALY